MAMLLALAFSLRLLSPAGFMPSFEHGAVTIISCPDAQPMAPMAAHRHHHGKSRPQPCPYAAAVAAGARLGGEPIALAPSFAAHTIEPYLRAERVHPVRIRDRPPATGPPSLPA